MSANKAAYSLMELIIVVSIVAVLAFMAVPRLQFATLHRKKADTVARKIVTDLRRTRRLAISNAATNTTGFAMRMQGPNGPSTREGYKIVDRSTNPATIVDEHTIDPKVTVFSDINGIRFGPLGNILQSPIGGYPSVITISAGGKTFTISFIRATGTVKCTEN